MGRSPEQVGSSTGSTGPIAFAGGGTGGHVVPGLHVLERLITRGSAPRALLWFGSGRAIEDRVLRAAGSSLAHVPLARVSLALEPPAGGAPTALRLALRTLPETIRARRELERHGARVVLGLGGFTTLPVVLAARSLGLPVLLLEINAVPGRATRALARFARRVHHAWPSTLPAVPGERHVHSGPPLSAAFLAGAPSEEEARRARSELGFEPERPLLLVLGGSQGAGSLNRLLADQARRATSRGLQVLHQAGPGRLGEGAGQLAAYRCVEYLDDVPRALAAATVVLCRGGASTLAEVTARARPAVVVPYPHHADRHQERNARLLGDGVRVVAEHELGPGLVDDLVRLAGEEGAGERARMAAVLAAAVPSQGSERIARELAELASDRPRGA